MPGLDGYHLGPTVFSRAEDDWRLTRAEIFGPVMVVIPWPEDAEVLAVADDSHDGLAAFRWCHDLDRAITAANRIESGCVRVDQGGGQLVGQSYGGLKASGIGREFSLEGDAGVLHQHQAINVELSSGPAPRPVTGP